MSLVLTTTQRIFGSYQSKAEFNRLGESMKELKTTLFALATMGFAGLLGWWVPQQRWWIVAACLVSWSAGALCGEYEGRLYNQHVHIVKVLYELVKEEAGKVIRGPWKVIKGGKKDQEDGK